MAARKKRSIKRAAVRPASTPKFAIGDRVRRNRKIWSAGAMPDDVDPHFWFAVNHGTVTAVVAAMDNKGRPRQGYMFRSLDDELHNSRGYTYLEEELEPWQ